jgi:large subunit ribosomal protein L17
MRHRKAVSKLGRTAAHRKSLMANMSASLFEHKHITTTEAKAKAVRRFSEKLITLAKKDSVHARRIALRKLRHRKVVERLFNEIAPKFTERNGGYTRVIKLGQRDGDAARMAILELVGFDMASKKKKAKEAKEEPKKKKRGKKGKEAKEEPAEAETAAEETAKETKAKEKPAKKAAKKTDESKAKEAATAKEKAKSEDKKHPARDEKKDKPK